MGGLPTMRVGWGGRGTSLALVQVLQPAELLQELGPGAAIVLSGARPWPHSLLQHQAVGPQERVVGALLSQGGRALWNQSSWLWWGESGHCTQQGKPPAPCPALGPGVLTGRPQKQTDSAGKVPSGECPHSPSPCPCAPSAASAPIASSSPGPGSQAPPHQQSPGSPPHTHDLGTPMGPDAGQRDWCVIRKSPPCPQVYGTDTQEEGQHCPGKVGTSEHV